MQTFYRGFSYFCVATAKCTMLSHALLFIYLFIYFVSFFDTLLRDSHVCVLLLLFFFLLHNVIT